MHATSQGTPDDPVYVDYASWGEAFYATAITVERVLSGINVLAGQPIDVGPMGVGPGRIVKVRATGSIGTATCDRVSTNPVTFRVALPVSLDFVIDLGMDKHRFTAEMSVPLVITARARRDLTIVLDVTPPTPQQVVVRLKAQGLRASITQHAANVEGELKRFVSKYVAREIDKPHLMRVRVIDVSGAIDRAISSLLPTPPRAEDVLAEFDEALAAEIQHNEQLFTDVAEGDEGAGTQ